MPQDQGALGEELARGDGQEEAEGAAVDGCAHGSVAQAYRGDLAIDFHALVDRAELVVDEHRGQGAGELPEARDEFGGAQAVGPYFFPAVGKGDADLFHISLYYSVCGRGNPKNIGLIPSRFPARSPARPGSIPL